MNTGWYWLAHDSVFPRVALFNIDLFLLKLSQCYCPGEASLNVWVNVVLMSLWIAPVVLMISKLFPIASRLLPPAPLSVLHHLLQLLLLYCLKSCDDSFFVLLERITLWSFSYLCASFSPQDSLLQTAYKLISLKTMLFIFNWQQL